MALGWKFNILKVAELRKKDTSLRADEGGVAILGNKG